MSESVPVTNNHSVIADIGLPSGEPILTRARPGTKAGIDDNFHQAESLMTLQEAREWVAGGGNYGFALGQKTSEETLLVVLDVEIQGKLPPKTAEIVDKYSRVVYSSPHGGENSLVAATPDAYELLNSVSTEIDLDDDGVVELEILTNIHALGPGSAIDHENCRDSKAHCPGEGRDPYELVTADPDAPVIERSTAGELVATLGVDPEERPDTEDSSQGWNGDLPDVDENLADTGDEILRELQREYPGAFRILMNLLRGETGGYDELFRKQGDQADNSIDRSLHDVVTLNRLYGTARLIGKKDVEQAQKIALATFEQCLLEKPCHEDGEARKWLTRGDRYQSYTLQRACDDSDLEKTQRFLKRQPVDHEYDRWTGTYSETTYAIVQFVIDVLTGEVPERMDPEALSRSAAALYDLDLDQERLSALLSSNPSPPVQDTNPESVGCVSPSAPDYPEQSKVVEACQLLDPSRTKDTHEEVLRRLRRDGTAAQARVGQHRYIVYPSYLPDPPDASVIRCNGEKREPESTFDTSSRNEVAQALREHKRVTKEQLIEATGFSERTVRRALHELLDKDYVEKQDQPGPHKDRWRWIE